MYIEDDLRNFDEVEFEEEGRAYLFPPKQPKTKDADHRPYRGRGVRCLCQGAAIWLQARKDAALPQSAFCD